MGQFRPSLDLLTILLAGVLFVTGTHAAAAQDTAFDVDEPISSLHAALENPKSNAQLVAVATDFLQAREDWTISYSTFRNGMWAFRTLQPDFYGNFFGDPFFATYDAEYFKMSRLRYLAALEVDPFGELSGMFRCNPLNYDPAFGGWCRGLSFAAADFFLLPDFDRPQPAFTSPLISSRRVRNRHRIPRPDGEWKPEPRPRRDPDPEIDTSRHRIPETESPVSDRESTTEPESEGTIEVEQKLAQLSSRLQLPDDLRSSMEEKAEELERTEAILRVRRLVEGRFGSTARMSDRQRYRVARELADGLSTDHPGEVLSQVREIEQNWAERSHRNVLERPGREYSEAHEVNPTHESHRELRRSRSQERTRTSSTRSEASTRSGESEGSGSSNEGGSHSEGSS